jgi:hypothetical protein
VPLRLDELVIGYGVEMAVIDTDCELVELVLDVVDGTLVTETELRNVALLTFDAGAYVVEPDTGSVGPDVEGIEMEDPAGVVAPVVLRAWLEEVDG